MRQDPYAGRRKNTFLWIFFVAYIIIAGVVMCHHELWGDELHSWNIAKGSKNFLDLIHNTRYEGHPPGWYSILWIITRFTHNLAWLQGAQFVLIVIAIYLLLFHSQLPVIFKILIPFGYYFIFEYAILSRNYAAALVACFIVCIIIRQNFKYKIVLYYFFLFLLSNTHLLAALLATSVHVYYLMKLIEAKKKNSFLVKHIVTGIIVLLPALYFIAPPSDGALSSSFLFNQWHLQQQLSAIIQMPLRSFIPIEAWWEQNFWNTQFLLDLSAKYTTLKFIYPLISVVSVLLILYVLRNNRKAVMLFTVNLILSCIVCNVFPLTSARYSGFIFISFIVCCWLYYDENIMSVAQQKIVIAILCIQVIAGIYAAAEDIRKPFSKLYTVDSLIKEVPQNIQIVTDYWALNAVSAYTQQGMYCIDLRKKISFILWNSGMKALSEDPYRYSDGATAFFEKQKTNEVYMISTNSAEVLKKIDQLFFTKYNVELVDERTGAIEKGSNLYLYHISTLQ